MDKTLSALSNTVREWMILPATVLNNIAGGRVTPNQVTLTSLLGHLLIVWALIGWHPIIAAVLLIFFGLMDSLDGALARLQKTSSPRGMLYDSCSDRVKEVLIYIGLIFWAPSTAITYANNPGILPDFLLRYGHGYGYLSANWIIVAVCGMSLVVSYIRARGETALIASGAYAHKDVNKVFSDGLGRYEIRMALIIIGLLTNTIIIVLPILLLIVTYTALVRIVKVSKLLSNV